MPDKPTYRKPGQATEKPEVLKLSSLVPRSKLRKLETAPLFLAAIAPFFVHGDTRIVVSCLAIVVVTTAVVGLVLHDLRVLHSEAKKRTQPSGVAPNFRLPWDHTFFPLAIVLAQFWLNRDTPVVVATVAVGLAVFMTVTWAGTNLTRHLLLAPDSFEARLQRDSAALAFLVCAGAGIALCSTIPMLSSAATDAGDVLDGFGPAIAASAGVRALGLVGGSYSFANSYLRGKRA